MKYLLIGMLPLLLHAATEPRPKASDYPAHVQDERAELGAEYLSRTISEGKESYYTGVYLVVEVAIYPHKDVTLPVAASDFQLRINGKKIPIVPATPGMVAVAIRDPDWEGRRTGVIAGGGIGDADIYVGGRRPVERFPGDRQGTQTSQNAKDGGEAAIRLALPELRAQGPVSGLIYFAYKSKQNKIRSIDLIYEGPAGRRELVLR